jgi:hypothetical protein
MTASSKWRIMSMRSKIDRLVFWSSGAIVVLADIQTAAGFRRRARR